MFEGPSSPSLFLHVFNIPSYDLQFDLNGPLQFQPKVFPSKDNAISILNQDLPKTIQ